MLSQLQSYVASNDKNDNLLRPNVIYMYHLLYRPFFAHRVYVLILMFSEQAAIIYFFNSNRLITAIVTGSVSCAGTD
jgi:hypothetical protein